MIWTSSGNSDLMSIIKLGIFNWLLDIIKILLSYRPSEGRQSGLELPPIDDSISATRILCGALLLPSVATVFGKVLFERVQSNFHRTLLVRQDFINHGFCGSK